MPSATLTFTLPEEREEYEDLMNAVDERDRYRRALAAVFEKVRNKAKYHDLPRDVTAAYEQVKEWFSDVSKDYDVELF